MKLKSTFVTQEMGDEQVMLSTDSRGFSGLVRFNATAAFVVDCLKEETTRESIVDAMFAKYDAPRNLLEEDVDAILKKLRGIGALDE